MINFIAVACCKGKKGKQWELYISKPLQDSAVVVQSQGKEIILAIGYVHFLAAVFANTYYATDCYSLHSMLYTDGGYDNSYSLS